MTVHNLYPGQNKHPGNPLYLEEVRKTRLIPKWKEELLSRANNFLGFYAGMIRQVGFRISEVQLQYDSPIDAFVSFQPLKAAWAKLNVWEPFTRKPGTRMIRFSEPTGTLMLLVRSPKDNGDWDWYLLCRKKYQFGAGGHIVEFTRGWVLGNKPNEMGWALLDRDYPGLNGADFVKGIKHTMLGSEVWENTAEFTNKTSDHIIVVTLSRAITKEELKKILVREKLNNEYDNVRGYSHIDHFDETDLVSEPMVFALEEAAVLINAHLTNDPTKGDYFKEKFSRDTWRGFLATCGWKHFPHLMPETCDVLAP